MIARSTTEADWVALKTVRLAALRDAPTAFGVSYDAAAALTDDQWRERASGCNGSDFVLAFADAAGDAAIGLAAGVVDAAGHYNLIAMWVHPAARGTSAATQLVDAVKQRAAARGHTRMVLDVAPANARAAAFYVKQGFVFLPEWEALASFPDIKVQKMAWRADAAVT